MKEGSYSLAFATNGLADEGSLQLKKQMLLGSTTRYSLSGQIVQQDAALTADLLVMPKETPEVADLPLPTGAVLKLVGKTEDGVFYLSGTGPKNVLIEIACKWQSAYVDGLAD